MKILVIGDSHLQRVQDSLFEHPVTLSSRDGMKAFDFEHQIFHQDFDVFILILGGNDVHFHQRKNPAPRTPAACAAKLHSCQITLYSRPPTEINYHKIAFYASCFCRSNCKSKSIDVKTLCFNSSKTKNYSTVLPVFNVYLLTIFLRCLQLLSLNRQVLPGLWSASRKSCTAVPMVNQLVKRNLVIISFLLLTL